MPSQKKDDTSSTTQRKQKEIEAGILKAIADITDETTWTNDIDADDVQAIITHLARSAALLREQNTIKLAEPTVKRN